MTPKCPDCKHDQDDCSCSETIESLRQQLAEREKQIVMLRDLIPKRIPDGFVSFGKYYSEQENKFNDPYNPMCRFKRKYLSDCEEALSATADLDGLILCENEPVFKQWIVSGGEKVSLYRAWEPK